MSTMRAAVLANYTDLVQQLGLIPEAHLRAVGLNSQVPATPDRLISSDAAVQLLENVAAQRRCDVFGLRLAEARGLSQFGVVSLLFSQQRSVRDALQMALKYLTLINASLALRLEEHGNTALLIEAVLTDGGITSRQAIELAMACNVRRGTAAARDRARRA